LFVKSGVLVYRQDRGKEKEAVSAAAGDGAITIKTVLLTDNGTFERRRSVRRGTGRQQAGAARRRADARPRGAPEAGAAA
jgi:hypothetical protein